MTDIEYAELQQSRGGHYIARRKSEVVASAATYDELSEQLEAATVEWGDLIIEYVEPASIIGVY
ncbi:MAG: hypothetical protein ACR2PL_00545 [Dehalococcoidia bacterium]